MSNFNLFEEALLVKLVVNQGQITAKSKTLTNESAENHKADKRRVGGTITKLTSEARAKLVQAINEGHLVFKKNCLPWEDRGYWMVPVSRYEYVKREIQRLRDVFMDGLQEMLDNYAELKADYERAVPGKLAQEVPFPTREELAAAFDFQLYEMAIPNTTDIRLNHVSPAGLENLRSKMQADMDNRLGATRQTIVDRLIENVKTLHTQTGNKESRLFKSLAKNIEEDCDVLPKLNLTKDVEIDRLITRVRTELSSLDIEDMKKNAKLRAQTHKLSGSILEELKAYNPSVSEKKPVVPPQLKSAKLVVEKLVDEPVALPVASFDFGSYAE